MSVSHKKINGLIERAIRNDENCDFDKDKLIQLCQKVYLIESSVDDRSRSQLLNDLREEIIRRAPNLLEG